MKKKRKIIFLILGLVIFVITGIIVYAGTDIGSEPGSGSGAHGIGSGDWGFTVANGGMEYTPNTIGGGVNNLTLFIDNLQELKRRGIKNFYIAYDMDKLTNNNVLKAQNRLIERLELERL